MEEKDYSAAGKAIRDTMRVGTATAWLRGIIGAILGAIIGYFVYFKLLDFGLEGLMIPGALVGLGFSLLSRRSFWTAGLFCAVLGLVVMLFCEWQSLLDFKDKDVSVFLKNIPNLNGSSKIMLVIGTFMAFWIGRGK